MKGICHIWSRGRHFSPSLPGDRYLNLGSKSDLRAEISGSIVWYDALAPRPEVLLSWYSVCACAVSLGQKFLPYSWEEVSLQRYCSHFMLFMQIMCFFFFFCTRTNEPLKILSFVQHGELFRASFLNNSNVVLELILLCFWHFEVSPKNRSFLRISPYHSLCKIIIFATF